MAHSAPDACNIGSRGRRRRLTSGLAALAVGAAIAAVLILTGAERFWRFALFLPFWAGALGMFQAKEKT